MLWSREAALTCFEWWVSALPTLSPHMVRNHSANLCRKLDGRSSLEAVMAAVRMGVLWVEEEWWGIDQN